MKLHARGLEVLACRQPTASTHVREQGEIFGLWIGPLVSLVSEGVNKGLEIKAQRDAADEAKHQADVAATQKAGDVVAAQQARKLADLKVQTAKLSGNPVHVAAAKSAETTAQAAEIRAGLRQPPPLPTPTKKPFLSRVPTAVWIGGGAVGLGLVAFFALRSRDSRPRRGRR